MYKEKDLTSDFSSWLRKNPEAYKFKFSFAVEFKLKHNKEKLDFKRDFQPQQIPSLLKVQASCLYHKISDQGIGTKPFDALQLCNEKAFIGIMWYKLRKPKILYLIDPRDIIGKDKIYETEAKQLATNTITL